MALHDSRETSHHLILHGIMFYYTHLVVSIAVGEVGGGGKGSATSRRRQGSHTWSLGDEGGNGWIDQSVRTDSRSIGFGRGGGLDTRDLQGMGAVWS